jgi:heme-degrading monooxygenase HmoA
MLSVKRRTSLVQFLWEFIVRDDKIVEFEKFYSSTGNWAALFSRSSGFLDATLLRDTQTPHRYLTIDRWDSLASHQTMRERFGREYEDLDRACEALMESERQIGVFEDLVSDHAREKE